MMLAIAVYAISRAAFFDFLTPDSLQLNEGIQRRAQHGPNGAARVAVATRKQLHLDARVDVLETVDEHGERAWVGAHRSIPSPPVVSETFVT